MCLKINEEELCSNSENQDKFKITDDMIQFNDLFDGVSSFEMVVDDENGGIQMSNIMVLYSGLLISWIFFKQKARGYTV